MSQLRASIQGALLSVYQVANRYGLLDSALAESVFQRSYFAYKYIVEDPFAKLVKARPGLFRGGDILDVGANIGYTAAVFARAIDAPYRVHAFEPEERNFCWLGHTITRRKLGARVVAHRAAVGAHEGTIDLWCNPSHHGDHRIATREQCSTVGDSTQRVPLTTVDAHVASTGWAPVAFVKIDVQGYEPEVLRGMAETIARNRGLHVAVELAPASLSALGFSVGGFVDQLAAALPRMMLLQHNGQLREADRREIMIEAERGRAYVDLVCTAS